MAPFNGLQPWIRPAATELLRLGVEAARRMGVPAPVVTSVKRSKRQQALLYRRYLAGQSKFPAAPPGTSKHELGLAFDIYTPDDELLRQLGHVWEAWGGIWGGRFNDAIHFEVAPFPKKGRGRK